MDPEGIILSERSQSKDKHYYFTYMWNLENKTDEQTKQNQSHRHREQIDACQRRRRWGRAKVKGNKRFTFPVIN